MTKSDEPPPEAGCLGCGCLTAIVALCVFAFRTGCTPSDIPNLHTPPVASAPAPEAPAPEAPAPEAPAPEAPKAEAPKAEAPKAEVPKAEVPKAEVPKLGPYPAIIVVQADAKFERLRAAGDLQRLRDELEAAKRLFTEINALHSRLDKAKRLLENPNVDSARQWAAFARQFKADADVMRAKVEREVDDNLLNITFRCMCLADLYLRQTVNSDPALAKYHSGCLSDVNVYLTTLEAKLKKAESPEEATRPSETFAFRRWKDKSGNFSTQAAFVSYGSGKVKLLKEGGGVIQVEVERLSDEDKDYLREIWRKQADANAHVSNLLADALRSFNKQQFDDAARTLNTALAVKHSTRSAEVTATIRRVEKEQALERDRIVAANAARAAEAERVRSARAAEAERARAESMAAEAARKAEEEYDLNGLVLLRKTVKGKRGEFDGEISGEVVNRRNRKLGYVQITFLLYDESGAQVGNALANINGLEAGGTWKFKASTFGTDFKSYKFNELTGF